MKLTAAASKNDDRNFCKALLHHMKERSDLTIAVLMYSND